MLGLRAGLPRYAILKARPYSENFTYMVSTVLVTRLLASIWLALDWCLKTSLCYRYRFRSFKASIEAFVRFWDVFHMLAGTC